MVELKHKIHNYLQSKLEKGDLHFKYMTQGLYSWKHTICYLSSHHLKTICMANFNYFQFLHSFKLRKAIVLPFCNVMNSVQLVRLHFKQSCQDSLAKCACQSQAEPCMAVIPAFETPRQGALKFEISLKYRVRGTVFKTQGNNNKNILLKI